MRAAPATPDELRATFDDLIARPSGDVPDDSGIDDDTTAAIERAWAANLSPRLVEMARHELEMQLDGTHAAEAADRESATFDQVAAQHGDQAAAD